MPARNVFCRDVVKVVHFYVLECTAKLRRITLVPLLVASAPINPLMIRIDNVFDSSLDAVDWRMIRVVLICFSGDSVDVLEGLPFMSYGTSS